MACHIGSRIGGKYRGADENQVSGRFTRDRLTENIHARDFDVVQRPAGDWNRAHHARGVIDRRIEATEWQCGRDAGNVHRYGLRRTGRACRSDRNDTT